MRQAWARQRHGDIGRQSLVPVDHAIVHIGRVFRIVEKHQLTGLRIDLRVCRNPVERHPWRKAERFQRFRVEQIALTALVKGRDRLARMDDDIGARRVLERPMGTEAGALRRPGLVHQPAPDRVARFLFGRKTARTNPAVTVGRGTTAETDLVDHTVTVEGMITAERLVQLVFGIAQVNAVDVIGNAPLDDSQVVRRHLLMQRRPSTVEIWVIAGSQRRRNRAKAVDRHSKQSVWAHFGTQITCS